MAVDLPRVTHFSGEGLNMMEIRAFAWWKSLRHRNIDYNYGTMSSNSYGTDSDAWGADMIE